ncbi:MAG: N-formylglutamate amidohydrolase [Maritimibacter sp.]
MKPPYELFQPRLRSTSVVFASPHSGRDYARAFGRRSVLDDLTLRSSEDAFVDELFAGCTKEGAPLIAANGPRAFVDLNRGYEELDPALIKGVAKSAHNPRVASGLGVIPRVVSGGRQIYRGKIPLSEAHARLKEHWYPYHDKLRALLQESHQLFGQAILIDCHSMPHEAIESLCRSRQERPEIVIGDRFGASAHSGIVEGIEAAFRSEGFKVARNTPFAGAYIAQHYGRPSRNQHVVQVEIDRALYMNEKLIRKNGNYASFQAALTRIIPLLANVGRANELPLAAE